MGWLDPGDDHFRPQVVGVVNIWKDFYPGMGTYHPRVTRALFSSPSQSAIGAPANQRSAGGVGVSSSCGAVSTRGVTVFVEIEIEFENRIETEIETEGKTEIN